MNLDYLNEWETVLSNTYDRLIETMDSLSDIKALLSKGDSSTDRIAISSIENNLTQLSENCTAVAKLIFAEDSRNRYLDNLKGYFNENTGTWTEQVCEAYKKMTGQPANEWTVLPFTIDVLNGASVFESLVHHGAIKVLPNGHVANIEDSETNKVFGYDMQRIRALEADNYNELRGRLINAK